MAAKLYDLGKIMKAATSALVSRAKLGGLAGKTFGGDRDTYAELGYARNLMFTDYLDRYTRGDIAARVVDAFPESSWRNSPVIESETSAFTDAYENLITKTRMYHYLARADKISGIGRYAVLLIGASGGASLSEPLPQMTGIDDVLFFAPYHEGNCTIQQVDVTPTSRRFGMPHMYRINLKGDLIAGETSTQSHIEAPIHWSRIVHLADGLLEDDTFGAPKMERVWNRLDDLDKVLGGSAEAVWQAANRGIQFDLDKDSILDPNDEAAFSDEVDEYMHGQRRYLRTQGIEANVLGGEVPDPRGSYNTAVSVISGATGIPQRILLGSEAGQMASSQDERNFNGKIKERQNGYLSPMVLRPLIERFQEFGALPKAEFKISWPDVSTLTEKEESDVAARMGQAIKHVSGQTKEGMPVISAEEFRDKYLGLEGAPPPPPAPAALPAPTPANDTSARAAARASGKKTQQFIIHERDANGKPTRITLE